MSLWPPVPRRQTPVLKLLVSCNAHNEKIIFSDVVKKINRKGSTQKRILMITTRAIYNLENNKCKRRIEVQDIGKIISSRTSDQFILHIPKEYDYHYSSGRSKEIVTILEKVHHVYVGESLSVETLDDKDLTKYVLTKKDLEKRNKSAHMARRSSAGDLMKSMAKMAQQMRPQMEAEMRGLPEWLLSGAKENDAASETAQSEEEPPGWHYPSFFSTYLDDWYATSPAPPACRPCLQPRR